MVHVLACIHGVDIERAGLGDFGKQGQFIKTTTTTVLTCCPHFVGNYLSRQINRWSKQYAASETHTISSMDSLMKWLNTTPLPKDRLTIVHGDYR